MLDIFKNDAFKVVNLTDALNELKYVPSRIAQMNVFRANGINTTTVAIEKKGNTLILVPPTPRGAPGTTVDKSKRSMLDIRVPHFEINDAIMAEEVQGVRAFGDEQALETVQGKVAERGAEHSQSMDATSEYSRVGAIKGVVTYADGSTLDLFSTFGVSQIAEINFDLGTDGSATGALRKKCADAVRKVANELEGLPWTGKLHALCGDAFFDDLLGNPEVRKTFEGWPEAKILREGYVDPHGNSFGVFEFGDIVWENYRGAVGGTSFVHTDKCHIFAPGVPGLFRSYWSPADYIETVNTVGKRLYGKIYDMPNGKGVHYDVQMNELNICTRPRTLLKGKRTA